MAELILNQNGKMSKMARGEMVRFLAENDICRPEGMKEFHALGFSYCSDLSDTKKYVFLKREETAE